MGNIVKDKDKTGLLVSVSPERIGRSRPTGSNAHTASPQDPLSCLKFQMLSIHLDINHYQGYALIIDCLVCNVKSCPFIYI